MLENFDYSEILSALELSQDYVSGIKDLTIYNEELAAYYRRLFEETGKDSYFRRNYAIGGCGQTLLFDFHHKKSIADLIRMELCHDRFCPNCMKLKQATRLQRFMPPILALTDDKAVFHIVLTAPNILGPYLRTYITIFFEACARLVRFLNGTDKIRGLDLSPLGFAAALRNTEITYGWNTSALRSSAKRKLSPRTDYHLHLHMIVAFNKNLYLPKIHRNKFSYDYSSGKRVYKRSFSDLEIFLQKLWRLLVDQITARIYKFGPSFAEPIPKSSPLYRVFGNDSVLRAGKGRKNNAVTLDAIRAMGPNDGYSVIMDPVTNAHFVQAFKYAFKVESENRVFMDYNQFSVLEHALYGRKLIQGYGAWFNLHGEDEIEEGFDEFFDVFKAYLWQVDRPESVNLTPDETLAKMREGEYTFITRSKLRHLLEIPSAQKLLEHKNEIPPAPKASFSFPDLALAYDRYIREKERSSLFANIRKIDDTESGTRILLLSEQQLNFLQDIF